ncbi:hypothetical protein MMC22_000357 [Lobaria immixta]|nr:hypothetical protein [Lobaria immixta]
MAIPHYLASPLSLDQNGPAEDYLGAMPPHGMSDQHGSYETADFGQGDDMFAPPLLHESSRTYSDSFTDATGLLDAIPPDQLVPEAASIDRDNKLLSFYLLVYNFTLLDYSLRRTSLSLTAQLHGMFFMAESPSAVAVDSNTPPAELTCYRRNLFQVSGSITLPRTLRYILTEQGDRIPIVAQELTISATESVEGHPVKLISVPWKTPASNSAVTPEDKSEKEPSSIPLDTMSNQDMDADYATFPIAWKRLQFRIATANNGRRKELQQHFVARLKVIATLSTGAKVSICEAKSGAIIVRGRSPRNFQQRKDFPVGGSASGGRKSMQPPSLSRNPTSEQSLKAETSPEQAFKSFNFDQQDVQTPGNFSDWNKTSRGASQGGTPATLGGHRNNTRSGSSTSKSPPAASTALSLTEDTNQRSRSHKAPRTSNTHPYPYKNISLSSSATFLAHSPNSYPEGHDSADLLYEYFPLGLEDWQPPVDAVYRPHVVHHMSAAGATAAGGRPGVAGRSKRYFSEDQS